MDDLKRLQTAFRTAFDYAKRQLDKIPASAEAERFFNAAAEDMQQTGRSSGDALAQELLIDVYLDLERVWKREHP